MLLRKVIVVFLILSVSGPNIFGEAVEPNDLSAYYGFGEMEIIKLDWGIKDLRFADINGDGRKDIAVVNNRKARIELLLQKESIGPGEAPVTVAAEDIDINEITPATRFDKQSLAVSQRITSFVCGDLNSDGMTDLAYYGDPKGLYVYLQKAPVDGSDKTKTLSWRTYKKIEIDDGLATSNALVCTDLNNDGAADLALAGQESVYVILQKDGSLAEPVKYPSSFRVLAVEAGDLNGDAITDLMLVTHDREKPISIKFGLETGSLGPQRRFFIEFPHALRLYDLDGVAGDEVLTVDAKGGRLICYKLSDKKEEETDWPILFYPLATGEGSAKRDLAIEDFDGDGLSDVVISDPAAAELIFYKQTAKIGLDELVRFPTFADIDSISAADIDHDGKSELAVLSKKEKVIGLSAYEDQRLSFPKPLELTGQPLAMQLSDMDCDGQIDCVYISKDANELRTLRVIYNLSAPEPELETPLELEKFSGDPDAIKVVDADQDGLLDVLIFDKYNPPALLAQQVLKRQFELVDSGKSRASLLQQASASSTAVADVDEKPGEELLIAQDNFARSLVFSDEKRWTVIDQYNAKSKENSICTVGVFDIGGAASQGRSLLLLDCRKGRLQVLTPGSDKTYRFKQQIDVGQWNVTAGLTLLSAALTGSELENILLFDGEKFALISPQPAAAAQQIARQFSYETKIKDGAYGNLVAGDINSDLRADIVMVEYRKNHIEILALGADGRPIPAMRFKVFEHKSYRGKQRGKRAFEPRELEIVDVTGDGKADLVTIIHDRIIIYPQD